MVCWPMLVNGLSSCEQTDSSYVSQSDGNGCKCQLNESGLGGNECEDGSAGVPVFGRGMRSRSRMLRWEGLCAL